MKRDYIEIDTLLARFPLLMKDNLPAQLRAAADILTDCFAEGGKLLICGNGGSAADADHIVAELMKNFLKNRSLKESLRRQFESSGDPRAGGLAKHLQGALPAINLSAHTAFLTAFSNDADGSYVFAQQVAAYGRAGDVLLALSTSGNSESVVNAAAAAKCMGLAVIGMTGRRPGKLGEYCDVGIHVDAESAPQVQELHLPVYHALCAEVERRMWHDS